MASSNPELDRRRGEILAKFRASRGTYRDEPKNLGSRREIMGNYLKPFLRGREDAGGGAVNDLPEETQIEALFDAVKEVPKRASDDEAGADVVPGQVANWEELLEGQGLQQFRECVLGWLGSAALDLKLSSTPLPELERLRAEAKCRQHVLEEMLKVTEREMDDLDVQIRALQDLQG